MKRAKYTPRRLRAALDLHRSGGDLGEANAIVDGVAQIASDLSSRSPRWARRIRAARPRRRDYLWVIA